MGGMTGKLDGGGGGGGSSGGWLRESKRKRD